MGAAREIPLRGGTKCAQRRQKTELLFLSMYPHRMVLNRKKKNILRTEFEKKYDNTESEGPTNVFSV